LSDQPSTVDREPSIQLDNLSVRYRVPQEHIPSIKEYAIRRLKRSLSYHEFWALDQVTFEVAQGECLGIIGSNGAGKSTLLKVIARVLSPTAGRVRVRGRVCPLLELGAGFDPELTGRENIFLNGTILGFTRRDLEARQDRIIEFAGLRDFIDSPLRTFSSGMIARLGFAIVTDETPDILIIDEILAVGDADFQKTSAERLDRFLTSGTTILLVSHSLADIKRFCERVIWLDHGRVLAEGAPGKVIQDYLDHVAVA
jgi:ABC-2 type transport system ATP-binding protein/lipopolysaccharide transport system ATP-binding protein